MNIFNESGALAVSTRLQRLSDRLRKDGQLIYQSNNIEFEPKWFPVIYALHRYPTLSIVELAEEIGYSHPSTISLLKELEKEKFIRSFKDKNDERKRMVKLTPRSIELIERMKPVWDKIKQTIEEITNTTNNLMLALDETEYQLSKESFFNRYQRLAKQETTDAIEVVDYTPAHAKAFYDLNIAWIAAAYDVEEEDIKVLSDPDKYILKGGGAIIIALYNGTPVGTCALIKTEPHVYEMVKMTVSSNMRGKNAGYLLGKAIIEKARSLGAEKIQLFSNRKGSAVAIQLYKKLGFAEIPLAGQAYKRADIKMELVLNPKAATATAH
ncbi:MAG: bifunctional helix-turn-helix transcriptional regulator/GNAT family N-acetyltransferase [Chitinophagaceae bacterium]